VQVTDEEDERSSSEAKSLRTGWLDFTRRLLRHLTTGRSARYDWRHDFEGSVELEQPANVAWDTLFESGRSQDWLPLDAEGLAPGAHLLYGDGQAPSRLEVSKTVWAPAHELSFCVGDPEWLRDTQCRLKMKSRSHGSLLTICHQGWRSIDKRNAACALQRHRAATLWVEALKRARRAVEG
jgi:hypothetical protein